MPTQSVILSRLFYLALLVAALLAVIGLLTRSTPAKQATTLQRPMEARLHFASLQPRSRIHKSAVARRPKRVLVVKPTANDQL